MLMILVSMNCRVDDTSHRFSFDLGVLSFLDFTKEENLHKFSIIKVVHNYTLN